MESAENIVKRFIDAYAARDLEAASTHLADNAVFTWPARPELVPYAGTAQGKDAFMQRLRDLDDLFEIHEYRPIEVVSNGKRVASRVHVRATGKGLKRTGEIELGQFWKVENGKVVELVEYFDTAAANLFN